MSWKAITVSRYSQQQTALQNIICINMPHIMAVRLHWRPPVPGLTILPVRMLFTAMAHFITIAMPAPIHLIIGLWSHSPADTSINIHISPAPIRQYTKHSISLKPSYWNQQIPPGHIMLMFIWLHKTAMAPPRVELSVRLPGTAIGICITSKPLPHSRPQHPTLCVALPHPAMCITPNADLELIYSYTGGSFTISVKNLSTNKVYSSTVADNDVGGSPVLISATSYVPDTQYFTHTPDYQAGGYFKNVALQSKLSG